MWETSLAGLVVRLMTYYKGIYLTFGKPNKQEERAVADGVTVCMRISARLWSMRTPSVVEVEEVNPEKSLCGS